jgi:hypothetical protein
VELEEPLEIHESSRTQPAMSEYEREKQVNIERNKALLVELGLRHAFDGLVKDSQGKHLKGRKDKVRVVFSS